MERIWGVLGTHLERMSTVFEPSLGCDRNVFRPYVGREWNVFETYQKINRWYTSGKACCGNPFHLRCNYDVLFDTLHTFDQSPEAQGATVIDLVT